MRRDAALPPTGPPPQSAGGRAAMRGRRGRGTSFRLLPTCRWAWPGAGSPALTTHGSADTPPRCPLHWVPPQAPRQHPRPPQCGALTPRMPSASHAPTRSPLRPAPRHWTPRYSSPGPAPGSLHPGSKRQAWPPSCHPRQDARVRCTATAPPARRAGGFLSPSWETPGSGEGLAVSAGPPADLS